MCNSAGPAAARPEDSTPGVCLRGVVRVKSKGNAIRRAAELLHQAERAGVIFEVREGEVEFFYPQHQQEELAGLFRQLKRWRAGIKRLLVDRAGADASVAIGGGISQEAKRSWS